MTITLSPEIEEAVVEQAREQGTTPEQVGVDGLRSVFVPCHRVHGGSQGRSSLTDYRINATHAADLRASLASFATDWK